MLQDINNNKKKTVTDQNKVTTKENSSERRGSNYREPWGTAGFKHTTETYRRSQYECRLLRVLMEIHPNTTNKAH